MSFPLVVFEQSVGLMQQGLKHDCTARGDHALLYVQNGFI